MADFYTELDNSPYPWVKTTGGGFCAPPPSGKYVVQLLKAKRTVELSVVRANSHGRRSWGWADGDKIILLCTAYYTLDIVERVTRLAHTLADELNAKERS